MSHKPRRDAGFRGRPHTGAWIEMLPLRQQLDGQLVAPIRGRGLKSKCLCLDRSRAGVAPIRGRGLK